MWVASSDSSSPRRGWRSCTCAAGWSWPHAQPDCITRLRVWQDIKNLDGARQFCLDKGQLGYRGMVCIHPSHVAIANEVFTPSAEQVDFYRRMIKAFKEAEACGSAAADFEGQHIDIAHVKTAEGALALADAIGASS
jgi:citrate lyase subunit beta/citryl-CoA lyase